MNRARTTLATALVSLLFSSGLARADFVEPQWHYDWLATPGAITLNADTNTKITMTNEPSIGRQGSSDVVATNLFTTSNATTPVAFSGVIYNLQLKITDDQTMGPDNFTVLNFTGTLSGSISKNGSLITNHFDDTSEHTFTIGSTEYTVVLDDFVGPSGPGAVNAGSIGGRITVVGEGIIDPPPEDVPEPSTLVLASLGLASLGLAARRKRHRNTAAV